MKIVMADISLPVTFLSLLDYIACIIVHNVDYAVFYCLVKINIAFQNEQEFNLIKKKKKQIIKISIHPF